MVRYDYRQRYTSATEALQAVEQLINQGEQVTYETPTILTPIQPCPSATADELQQPVSLEVKRPRVESDSQIARKQLAAKQRVIEQSTPLSRQEYRNRQILLNKVRNYWVKGVLETSLHGRSIIELGLEERSDAVARPWGLVWDSSDTPQQPLPPNTRLIDKFDEMGAGRTLLILGEPGSGKTTTLLELTRDLIERTELDPNQPMPVVFNLSSWSSNKTTIADWLVQELHTKYQVSQEIGKDWVKEQQLLPLLDGLDEVSAKQRQACVEAINHFHQEHGQTEMVVCSRIKDYEALSTRLRFQAAIYLQPLTLEQIHYYLAGTGKELATLSAALQVNPTLQELAKSPLMLSIMTLAYQGMPIEELPTRDVKDLCHHLFNTYIERMFNRRGANSPYSKEQAMRWLIWLAKQMTQKSETVFLIDRMQPTWLETKLQKWMYAIAVALIGGLTVGLGAGVNVGRIFGLNSGLMAGLIIGLGGCLLSGLMIVVIVHQIEPVETLKWSWTKAKKNLLPGLRVGVMVGLVFALIFSPAMSPVYGIRVTLIDSLSYGLSGLGTGLIFILLQGLTGSWIETRTVPNQGIRQSAKNAVVFTLIGLLSLGLVAELVGGRILIGTTTGLLFGMLSPAGIACLQHFALRLVLYCNGYVPWNYARFLDYATQLIFLQKVGGGYIFIHRLLLEHFAGLAVEPVKS
jgi:hypothetical protein